MWRHACTRASPRSSAPTEPSTRWRRSGVWIRWSSPRSSRSGRPNLDSSRDDVDQPSTTPPGAPSRCAPSASSGTPAPSGRDTFCSRAAGTATPTSRSSRCSRTRPRPANCAAVGRPRAEPRRRANGRRRGWPDDRRDHPRLRDGPPTRRSVDLRRRGSRRRRRHAPRIPARVPDRTRRSGCCSSTTSSRLAARSSR